MPSEASAGEPALDATPVSPVRTRREPPALDQLPVWEGFGPLVEEPVEDSGLTGLLSGLNPEQRRAVTHGDGPLLVVAGAGTGKTEVITRRIAWLVATRRARPAEILGLTFTDKAASEMQLRVDQLVPYGFADTAISTFHAFGDRLIREFAFELGISPDARVLSRAETVMFLREHLFELGLDAYLPLGDPTRFLGALATLFGRCRDEDVSPSAYRAHADALAASAAVATTGRGLAPAAEGDDPAAAEALTELAARQDELASAYGRYTELLAASGSIDFGDQVALALRLLRESAATLSTVRTRYRYILVDEFQDTNPVQSALVGLLAARHRNITVVGDDDQSIYRFRGAAISNILEFRDRYRGARTVVLRRNYRSTAPILDASYRLIKFNDPDRLETRVGISKQLLPQRPATADVPVRHHAFGTGSEESDWIAAEFRRRIDAGVHPRDLAVLVRANAGADPILRSLNLAGVPWRFAGTSGLYGRPEVRLLLSVLRAVADLESSPDVYALAASDVYGVPSEDLSVVMSAARRGHRSAWAVLEDVDARTGTLEISSVGRPSVVRLVGDLRRLRDLAHARPAGDVLYTFLRDSGWLAALAAAGTAAAEEALANLARFFDIVRARSALLADDRAVFLAPHLGTLIEAGDDPATADPDPDLDVVTVMTVHKAKGLEFPVVVLPGLVAGRFPSTARREPLAMPDELVAAAAPDVDPHLPEERRLFYVAMTRARDELILTHAADYGGGAGRPGPAPPPPRGSLGGGAPPPGLAVRPRGARPADVRGDRGSGRPGHGSTSEAGRTRPAGGRCAAASGRPDRGPAHAQPLCHRRLPVLPAEVPVRTGPSGAHGTASLHRVRRGAPPGRSGVSSRGGTWPDPHGTGARQRLRAGLDQRGVRLAGARAGSSLGRARCAPAVSHVADGSRGRGPGMGGARVHVLARRGPDPGAIRPGRHRGGRWRARSRCGHSARRRIRRPGRCRRAHTRSPRP